MNINLRDDYPKEYDQIKNLGYDSVEKRHLQPNLDLGFHSHPFTACMVILEGQILLKHSSEKVLLKEGDFVSVDRNVSHNEIIGLNGATILYGKKFNESKYNLAIIEDSLNALYLGDNNKLIFLITKNPASYILYLTLYKQHYSEIWKSQEDILNLIPKTYASRSTIINLIKDGVERNFIQKKRTTFDKRAVYYELNENIFNEIENWIAVRKSNLVNIFKSEKNIR